MKEQPQYILPGNTLRVIIRSDAPLVLCQDSPAFRSVEITLTEEQREQLRLYRDHGNGYTWHYEQISKCFIEPEISPELTNEKP